MSAKNLKTMEGAKTVRAIPGAAMKRLNNLAIKEGKNRALTDEFIDTINTDFNYPITMDFIHNDVEMRVFFYFPGTDPGGKEWTFPGPAIDISFEEFNALPVFEV